MSILIGGIMGLGIGMLVSAFWLGPRNKAKSSAGGAVTSNQTDYSISYEKFQADLEDAKFKSEQIFEDMEMGRKIHDEAFRLYEQWSNSHEWTDMDGKKHKGGMILINPFALSYVIYDSENAKYANVDRQKLVLDEFERLKTEFEKL